MPVTKNQRSLFPAALALVWRALWPDIRHLENIRLFWPPSEVSTASTGHLGWRKESTQIPHLLTEDLFYRLQYFLENSTTAWIIFTFPTALGNEWHPGDRSLLGLPVAKCRGWHTETPHWFPWNTLHQRSSSSGRAQQHVCLKWITLKQSWTNANCLVYYISRAVHPGRSA